MYAVFIPTCDLTNFYGFHVIIRKSTVRPMDSWYGRRDAHDDQVEPCEVILSCWTCWELQKFQIMDLRSNALLTTSWLVLSPRWSFKHWSRPTIGFDASTDFHAFQLDFNFLQVFARAYPFSGLHLLQLPIHDTSSSSSRLWFPCLWKEVLLGELFFRNPNPPGQQKLVGLRVESGNKIHRILHASSSSPNLTVRKCETIAGWFKHAKRNKALPNLPQTNPTFDQWDFQEPPIMGPVYGKFPILCPYYSYKNP